MTSQPLYFTKKFKNCNFRTVFDKNRGFFNQKTRFLTKKSPPENFLDPSLKRSFLHFIDRCCLAPFTFSISESLNITLPNNFRLKEFVLPRAFISCHNFILERNIFLIVSFKNFGHFKSQFALFIFERCL